MSMEGRKRILLVDDDQDVLELLHYNLSNQGYKVKCIYDSETAIDEASRFSPDLIVLDIMMPNINGIELCRKMRKIKGMENLPLFFLTAKTESSLVEVALECGGDDLIHKMMGLRSLITRINAVLKDGWVIRKRMAKLTIGILVLDRRTSMVQMGNRQVQLSVNEFELLYLLAQNPTRKINAESIRTHIWGSDIFHVAAPVDDLAERITRKLGMKWIIETDSNQFRLNSKLI